MNAGDQASRHSHSAAFSLTTAALTVVGGTISHVPEYGQGAVAAGIVLLVFLVALNVAYRSTKSGWLLTPYLLLNLFLVVGFGLVNGFWNHAFKAFLVTLHNGYLPPMLARLFSDPKIGTPFMETVGVLTFVASAMAAYFGFKLVKERK